MAGTVGGIACDFVKGVKAEAVMRSDLVTRPGIDGACVQLLAKKPGTFFYKLVKFGLLADVGAWSVAIGLLVNSTTLLTVVNDLGELLEYCTIQEITPPATRPAWDGILAGRLRRELVIRGVSLPT